MRFLVSLLLAVALVQAQPAWADEPPARELKYLKTPNRLKISVEGVDFKVKATPQKIGKLWGIKLELEAQSTDNEVHVLLSSKDGPLAFAQEVQRKSASEPERNGETREGEKELRIEPGKTLKIVRTWPSGTTKALAEGDSCLIQVALWGIASGSAARRPVKKFFQVAMEVGKGKPKAEVDAPASINK